MATQTYSDVIESNPSYSAKRYKERLPYAILTPAIGGLALILCFFLLPWFSIGLSLSSPKLPNAGSLMNKRFWRSNCDLSRCGSLDKSLANAYHRYHLPDYASGPRLVLESGAQ